MPKKRTKPTKYTLHVEDDKLAGVEINGRRYASPEQIPDRAERNKVKRMLAASPLLARKAAPADSSAVSGIVLWVFAGVAALMLGIAIFAGVLATRGITQEVRTDGHVIELVRRSGYDGNEFYYPVVEFYLPDDTRQVVQLAQGSFPPAYSEGELVTVLYDPAQPRNARIQSSWNWVDRWLVSLITGFLGLAFLAATVFTYWLNHQPPPAWAAAVEADLEEEFAGFDQN